MFVETATELPGLTVTANGALHTALVAQQCLHMDCPQMIQKEE